MSLSLTVRRHERKQAQTNREEQEATKCNSSTRSHQKHTHKKRVRKEYSYREQYILCGCKDRPHRKDPIRTSVCGIWVRKQVHFCLSTFLIKVQPFQSGNWGLQLWGVSDLYREPACLKVEILYA